MMGASSYIRQRSSTSGELNRRGGPNRALVRPPTLLDADDLRGLRLAVRSREMLENGTHATIAEIAAAEKINESYVGRVLRVPIGSDSRVSFRVSPYAERSAGNCAPECIGERQGRARNMGDTSMLGRVRRLKVDHR